MSPAGYLANKPWVRFYIVGDEIWLEQNPRKNSIFAEYARTGHEVYHIIKPTKQGALHLIHNSGKRIKACYTGIVVLDSKRYNTGEAKRRLLEWKYQMSGVA